MSPEFYALIAVVALIGVVNLRDVLRDARRIREFERWAMSRDNPTADMEDDHNG